jgi:nucleoside 2-deoxyribosyltransferase
VYVAGPLFSVHEREFLVSLVNRLAKELSFDPINDFFLPHRDAGDLGVAGKTRDMVFYDDLKFLDGAELIVALLDGPDIDSGTALEMGYAHAKGKPIFGILTDLRKWSGSELGIVNNMVWGVCEDGTRIHRTVDSLASDLKNFLAKKGEG